MGLLDLVQHGKSQMPPRIFVYGTEGMIEASGDQVREGEPWLRARLRGEGGWSTQEVQPNDAVRAEMEVSHLHEKVDNLNAAILARLHAIEGRLERR